MAKKQEVKNTKKAPQKSSPNAKSVKNVKGKEGKTYQQRIDFDDAPQRERKPKDHSAAKSATPYIMILLGVIFIICLFTVHVLSMDDGVGIVGSWISLFLCGLFGISSFLVPLALIYIGAKWCIYNVKKKSDEEEEELIRYKKRNILQTVMAALFIILLAALVGVLSGVNEEFDIVEMWESAAEDLEGGGIIGGSISVLMIMAFESVISSIVIIVALVFTVIFIVGLTPDRIVMYFRNKALARREERLLAEEEERMLEEEERLKEFQHQSRLKASKLAREEQAAEAAPKKKLRAMSVDEMMNDDDEEEIDTADAVIHDEPEAKEIYIGPSQSESKKSEKAEDAPEDAPEPEAPVTRDFGGDPVFDNTEFKGIANLIDSLEINDTPEEAKEPTLEVEKEDLDLGEIESEELLSDMAAVAPDDDDEVIPEVVAPYVFPHYDLLNKNTETVQNDYQEELRENAQALIDTLKSFRVGIKEVTYSRGPTITRYELKPEVGTRVRSIANLVDDIALSLATSGVRIEAPIPNKAAVGIEVPNRERATVYLRDLIENPKFTEAKSRLTASLGMDVGGNPIYFDIAKMPHLLIAGTTGSGKSICINSIIISILYKAKPDDVKLILIDPKKVEFNMYKTIPHLYCPIVSEPKKAAGALASAVAEMERRFELIETVGVRDIGSYNAAVENDPEREYMPQMVIIIDELADLMMTARDEVETSICRLAQKARAAGIHLILGTQRPSVDVITGLIKANVPSRIACTVNSQVDSRTIIDVAGAENLIGRGDMLFAPVGSSKPMRVQGAFVSDSEVENVVTFISETNGKAKYNTDFINRIEEEAAKCGNSKKGGSSGFESDSDSGDDGGDSKFKDAVKLAIEEGKISTSLMQRRLGVGYGRAAKIIDTMEEMGYVSKPDGNKPRRVLITMDEYMRRVSDGNLGSTED
ncbi:MAG: DNA translocase FtsK [Ruminococcaceae bacterium]|nr:DNA translocase FtsK [Oscillospiraceae bacterium]